MASLVIDGIDLRRDVRRWIAGELMIKIDLEWQSLFSPQADLSFQKYSGVLLLGSAFLNCGGRTSGIGIYFAAARFCAIASTCAKPK